MAMRVLVAEPQRFPPAAADLLGQLARVELVDLDRAGLLNAVRRADVLWVRLRHRIDAEVMAAAPRLKVIATPTTGLNHIDLEEASRRGIRVCSLRGEQEFLRDVRATAECTLALMLALVRRLPAAVAHARAGGWDRTRFVGSELHGKTVGIVGYGRLGRLVARHLRPFDVTLLASDPHVQAERVDPDVRLLPLPELLARSDIVTLHASYAPDTHRCFGREQFAAMRRGAWFINTARGELVDEDALLSALERGHLGGAALDVLSGEQADGMENHPLIAFARRQDSLIITPHIGGCTTESLEKTEMFLAAKVHASVLGGRS